MPTPPAEIEITAELVTHLLEAQHPDLAHLPVHGLVEGWDNVMMRLGSDLAVRLPRRSIAVDLARREHSFLRPIAESLDIGVPVPLRLGIADDTYPWPWSIVPWFDGTSAAIVQLHAEAAPRLGATLKRIHRPAPAELPLSPFRGVPLVERLTVMRDRLAAAAPTLNELGLSTEQVWAVWEPLAQTQIDVGPVLVHGDLHPRNVLTEHGDLVAIIDWGDMTPGDPATDASAVWSLFEPEVHPRFWEAYEWFSPLLERRARAWAIYFAVLWIADAGDVEEFMVMGRTTISRVMTCLSPESR